MGSEVKVSHDMAAWRCWGSNPWLSEQKEWLRSWRKLGELEHKKELCKMCCRLQGQKPTNTTDPVHSSFITHQFTPHEDVWVASPEAAQSWIWMVMCMDDAPTTFPLCSIYTGAHATCRSSPLILQKIFIVECIHNGDDSGYRETMEDFVSWCRKNNLRLNTVKTKQPSGGFLACWRVYKTSNHPGGRGESVLALYMNWSLEARLDSTMPRPSRTYLPVWTNNRTELNETN